MCISRPLCRQPCGQAYYAIELDVKGWLPIKVRRRAEPSKELPSAVEKQSAILVA